jgi:hypothetical protein
MRKWVWEVGSLATGKQWAHPQMTGLGSSLTQKVHKEKMTDFTINLLHWSTHAVISSLNVNTGTLPTRILNAL